jgi:pimeloyl-ACP methyl ester carboxylesterase
VHLSVTARVPHRTSFAHGTQVMPNVRCPVAVLWGEQDSVTGLDGPVGKYFRQLVADGDPRVQMQLIPNANHCPQDDTPQVVNEGIIAFAKSTVNW